MAEVKPLKKFFIVTTNPIVLLKVARKSIQAFNNKTNLTSK